jgi:hypothetical protein
MFVDFRQAIASSRGKELLQVTASHSAARFVLCPYSKQPPGHRLLIPLSQLGGEAFPV